MLLAYNVYKFGYYVGMRSAHVVVLVQIGGEVVQVRLALYDNQLPVATAHSDLVGLVELPVEMVVLQLLGIVAEERRSDGESVEAVARELAQEKELVLLCGHYEGVDQRALDSCIDEEISIGDYILTGGELAAMVLTDCVARFIPGVLGSAESPEEESFSDGLLEYPQYTRPRELSGMEVPDVLLSGDHAKIKAWRRIESLRATKRHRPDLLASAELTDKEKRLLEEL